jgi:hypothetical protein
MRAVIGLLLASALPALGQNLYGLQGTAGYGTANIPGGSPWNGLSNFRVEFRLHNWSGTGRLFQWDGLVVSLNSGSIGATDFYDSGSPTVTASFPSGVTDVVVRLQRTPTQWRIEMWPSNGSQYVPGGVSSFNGSTISLASTSLALMHNGGGGSSGAPAVLDWFRVFSTAVAADSAPPSNGATGDLLNYELESNGSDTSGRGITLSIGGTPSWPQTPVVPQIGESRTVRAGAPFTVDCGSTNAASYFWQQVSGPQTVTFSSRTAAAPVVSGADVFGEYRLQCTAVNALGQTGSTTVAVGAVASTAAGVVVPGNAAIGFTTGELLRGGASPWPFYDRNRPRRALTVGALLTATMAATINTPLEGTVTLANGSASVTGSGTLFLTRYAAGAKILLYYDQGGGRLGRAIYSIASVASNTSLTLSSSWNKPSQTSIQHQRWGTGDGSDADGSWAEGYNYYDNVLAMYISYYKTGLSQIAAYADQMAQYWWLHTNLGLDYGFAPRQASLEGLTIAAQRGVIDANEVYTFIDNFSWSWTGGTPPGYRNYVGTRNTSTGYQNFYFGARESGYSLRHAVVLAQQHPNTTVQSTWLTRLAANVQNHYRDYQCKAANPSNSSRCRYPEGGFRWADDAWSPDLAEQPWHTGIIMQGMIRYHRLTSNTVARSVITDWVNHMMVDTQPNGSSSHSLYLGDIASSFSGINCRGHYYWHQRGSEATFLSTGGDAGAGCGGAPESVYGVRDTNNEIISSMGYAYRLTGNTAVKTRGDDIFGGTWGADDGYFGQWAWSGAPNQGKTHGQGLCCNDSYLVDRLGATAASRTPQPLPLRIGFRLQSVPGAISVRLTVVRPDGQPVTADCTSSPCSVSGDRQQGEHRFKLEYRSSGGAVLQASELKPVRVAP